MPTLNEYIERISDASVRSWGIDITSLGLEEEFFEQGYYTGRDPVDFLLDIGDNHTLAPCSIDDEAGEHFQTMVRVGIARRLAHADHRDQHRARRARSKYLRFKEWKDRGTVAGIESGPRPADAEAGAICVDDEALCRGRTGGCFAS